MAGKVHWRRLETLLFFFSPATLSRLDNLDRISAQDRSVVRGSPDGHREIETVWPECQRPTFSRGV